MIINKKLAGFKAVIFDMDGTLVDNIPYHKKAWIQMLKNHHIEIDEYGFDAQNHGTGPEMIKRFFGEETSEERATELWEIKEEAYRSIYQKMIKPIDGLIDLLELLKREDIKIALATMGTIENIDLVLDGLSIRGFFDVITKGNEVLKGKPHPEVYLKTIQKLQVPTEYCLAIEDSDAGINSAFSAGLKVIAITTSNTAEHFNTLKVNGVINTFFELIN